jgi:hypothetical protein
MEFQGKEHKKRVRAALRQYNEEARKPVYCIDMITGEIESFESKYDAEKAGYKRYRIDRCLNGERRSYKGRMWYQGSL